MQNITDRDIRFIQMAKTHTNTRKKLDPVYSRIYTEYDNTFGSIREEAENYNHPIPKKFGSIKKGY